MRSLAIAIACVLAAAAPALAEIDNDKADRLFREAVAMRDRDPAGACAKFEEALGFNPQAISTRLNVALCDEQAGRIASAVVKFIEVADRARENGLTEFQRAAEEKIALLSPKVPRVTFKLEEQLPGMKIVVDNDIIPLDRLVDRPIDPGDRVIAVSAPGRITYTVTLKFEIGPPRTVSLPRLATSNSNTRRTLGKIAVIAGGATAVTGIVVGLVARGRYNDAREAHCMPPMGPPACDGDGLTQIDSARTLGNVGTVVTVLGIGAAAVGGFLWWRSPGPERKPAVVVGPAVGQDAAFVVAAGRF
jgi:hypothetical protein